jgi:hypothetical protein
MHSKNAHAARIDDSGIVREVIVIPFCNDDDTQITEYCNSIGLTGTWLDTSYLGTRRFNYAGIGFTYDEVNDAFIAPKPSDGEWMLNQETFRWVEVEDEAV